jgi:hypothetical protein
VQVVDDLLPHVDGRPVEIERLLDCLDGALDPGAVTAGRREENALDHVFIVARRIEKPAAMGGSSGGLPSLLTAVCKARCRGPAVRIAQCGARYSCSPRL